MMNGSGNRIEKSEREAMATLDRMILLQYPDAAKAYAPLAELERNMLEPDAPKDHEKWEAQKKRRDRLEREFWQVMKKRYGIDRPA
ncbi:MAG: hypothetical protein ACI4OJ_07460, partial [Lachnospiraceae bacterium]